MVISEIAAICRDPALADWVIAEAGARHDAAVTEANPTERISLLRSLVERIAVDGHAGKLAVTFRASGIADLAKRGVA